MELDVFIDSRHCQSFGTITVPVHKHRWQIRMKVAEPGEDSTAVVRYSKVLAAVTSSERSKISTLPSSSGCAT